MDFDLPTAFIFMKVGNHAGETFETILERKRREFDRAGKIFWGYGGTTLHPIKHVQPFVKSWIQNAGAIQLVMEPINSKADPDLLPAREYSADGIAWEPNPGRDRSDWVTVCRRTGRNQARIPRPRPFWV